ncbi:hypothetical protein CHISP_2927 [Chitinispirillum alkaliphilum]|nr:hypothetical protein CHISP_2927 [Chitinispirillum alkaliphilum]
MVRRYIVKKLIHQKKENGTICRKNKKRVWIALDIECRDKGAQKGCSGGCVSCTKKEIVRKVSVPVADSSDFKLGQLVTLSHYVPDPAIMSFVVFGIPLFMAFAALITWIFASPATIESALAVFFITISFMSGFLILKIIDLIFRKRFPATLLQIENYSSENLIKRS